MGSRPYGGDSERELKNRKQIKALWIRKRNELRIYPEGVIGDEIFCSEFPVGSSKPLTSTDFLFFHRKKRHYFVVNIRTAEHAAYEAAEDVATAELDKAHPLPEVDFIKCDRRWTRFLGWVDIVKFSPAFQEASKVRREAYFPQLLKAASGQFLVAQQTEIGSSDIVGSYVTAVVDCREINEDVLTDFVARFRHAGEPTSVGPVWRDGTVEISPLNFCERKAQAYKRSLSDTAAERADSQKGNTDE